MVGAEARFPQRFLRRPHRQHGFPDPDDFTGNLMLRTVLNALLGAAN